MSTTRDMFLKVNLRWDVVVVEGTGVVVTCTFCGSANSAEEILSACQWLAAVIATSGDVIDGLHLRVHW
jgi:hypothetical protein